MRFSSLPTAAVALAVLAPSAAAQTLPVGGVPRITIPSQNNLFSWERGSGFHGGFGNVWVVLRQAQDDRVQNEPVVREVVREVPVPVPVAPPEPRKPYVIGASYASLPGGCMKLIEDRVSYYYCSGDWYRQEGKSYRAVARRL